LPPPTSARPGTMPQNVFSSIRRLHIGRPPLPPLWAATELQCASLIHPSRPLLLPNLPLPLLPPNPRNFFPSRCSYSLTLTFLLTLSLTHTHTLSTPDPSSPFTSPSFIIPSSW